MMVDVTCGLVLVLFAIIGAALGFIRQVFSLLAVALIAVFALPLALLAARPILEGKEWGPSSVLSLKLVLFVAAALLIYIGVKAAGRLVYRAVGRREAEEGKEPRMAAWNRWWGAALSVAEAGVLCWLVVCFMAAFPRVWPSASRAVEESWSVRAAGVYNPFEHWMRPEKRSDLEQALLALWRLRGHPGSWTAVMQEESVQAVLKNDRVARLLDEGNGDFTAVVADAGFRNAVSGINWREVAEVARRALAEAERST